MKTVLLTLSLACACEGGS